MNDPAAIITNLVADSNTLYAVIVATTVHVTLTMTTPIGQPQALGVISQGQVTSVQIVQADTKTPRVTPRSPIVHTNMAEHLQGA